MAFSWLSTLLRVKFTLTLVLLTFSLFYPFTLVVTTGTSSDLSRKVRVTVYKGDTYRAVNL